MLTRARLNLSIPNSSRLTTINLDDKSGFKQDTEVISSSDQGSNKQHLTNKFNNDNQSITLTNYGKFYDLRSV